MLSPIVQALIRTGNSTENFWKRSIQTFWFIGEVTSALWHTLLNPKKARWREILYYMDMCGREAFQIVSLICFLMGLILGFQSAVQMQKFGASIFVADLVGLSILRELGPMMVAIICTGRASSAFAAEIGTMKVNEEIDAMVTMGINPTKILITPKIIGLCLVMPLLTIVGDFMGVIGGMVVGVVQLDLPMQVYLDRSALVLFPSDVIEGLIKCTVFSILIGGVGCLRGIQSNPDAQGVGRAATSAVLSGIFLIVLSDALMTMIFTVWRM
ncbi:MAG: ABC transporter permease [Lentisphaeraceae bacterium]|nr:ABC transporter permease [Lentisphaeraceae bacterium]